MADTAGPTAVPGLGARVARLEADVVHIRGDIADIKATLGRLAPRIDELRGFLTAILPTLATKAELANLRTELKTEITERLVEIRRLSTRRQSIFDKFAVVGFVGAVLAISGHFAH
jgi:hypothetical protein